MKLQVVKKCVTALTLAAMVCIVPAQGVLAAEKSYNMEYGDDDMTEQMRAQTANTTMTLNGNLDNTWYNVLYNNGGSGEFWARFDNLPTGAEFANQAALFVELSYDYGDDEDYQADCRYCMSLVGDMIWLSNGPQEIGKLTVAEAPFDNAFFGTLQNGVNYDVAATIDWMYGECVNNPEFWRHIELEDVATTYKKYVWVGVYYGDESEYGEYGWGIGLTGLSTDTYTNEQPAEDVQAEETVVEENVVEETTAEETTVEETVQEEVVYVQPEVTQGDLVYTVKIGDTLSSISANYYGDNSKAGAIRSANKEAFEATKGQLADGMQLVLPEKLGTKTRIAAPTANAGETLYVVMHGDSLSKIAKDTYGTEKKVAEIFARNADRMSDASKLFPGQVIVLPAN